MATRDSSPCEHTAYVQSAFVVLPKQRFFPATNQKFWQDIKFALACLLMLVSKQWCANPAL